MVETRRIIPAVEYYTKQFESRTADELRTIAHVKRFLELITMDSEFRQSLKDNPGDGKQIVQARGLDMDPAEFAPAVRDGMCLPMKQEDAAQFPLLLMWRNWIRDMRGFRTLVREDGYSDVADPKFNAWRKRQVERVNSEFGPAKADGIVHPIFCFELSIGCSMGCWFCAFGATPLRGVLERTPENTRLWRRYCRQR